MQADQGDRYSQLLMQTVMKAPVFDQPYRKRISSGRTIWTFVTYEGFSAKRWFETRQNLSLETYMRMRF